MVNVGRKAGCRKVVAGFAYAFASLSTVALASALSTATAVPIERPPDAALYEKAEFLAGRGEEAASAEILWTLVRGPQTNLSRPARLLLMLDDLSLIHISEPTRRS